MSLLAETSIVIIGHSLTAVISMALLLLVLWHAPRLRSNQLFAGMMLLLVIHSLLNIAGRFLQPLQLDPWPVYTLIMLVYLVFVLLTFFFTTAFAGLQGALIRRIKLVALTLGALTATSMYSRLIVLDVYPISGGGFNVTTGPLYIPLGATILVFLALTTGLLARSANDRARRLWPATALILAGYVALTLRPIIPLPLNAILLTAAALWMGYIVLQYQIFNPLAALNRELARTNVELAEANSLKNQFMANMSHELRTPLNSVIGYAELLLLKTYGPITDRQQDRLERIARNGRHLLNLINDILDLSKIEAGQMTLNLAWIETSALLSNVLATVEPLAEHKAITLVRDYAGSPPIYGDEVRIRQVFVNLLSNALKFTPQGSVTVHVEPALVEGMVRGYVRDTGIGIPAEKQAIIFEAFRQSDQSPTREFEGTGLGLTISRHYVELHGGRLWLESTPGQGATFHFQLPGEAQPAPLLSYPQRPDAAAADELPGASLLTTVLRLTAGRTSPILLVEPGASATATLQALLAGARLPVIPVRGADEACTWLSEHSASLVILGQGTSASARQTIAQCICSAPALAHLPVLTLPDQHQPALGQHQTQPAPS